MKTTEVSINERNKQKWKEIHALSNEHLMAELIAIGMEHMPPDKGTELIMLEDEIRERLDCWLHGDEVQIIVEGGCISDVLNLDVDYWVYDLDELESGAPDCECGDNDWYPALNGKGAWVCQSCDRVFKLDFFDGTKEEVK